MRTGRGLAAILLVAIGTACEAEAEPPGIPVRRIVQEYVGDGLELAVIPTPQVDSLADDLLPIGPLKVVAPPDGPATTVARVKALLDGARSGPPTTVVIGGPRRNPEAARLLAEDLGLPDVSGRGPEAYRLIVTRGTAPRRGTLVILAGNSPAADFWALQTLAQLVAEKDGRRYVRRGAVADWPAFPKRGSKRPHVWEHRFKANYAWTWKGDDPKFREVFRTKGAWVRQVSRLRLDEEDWVEAELASARAAYDRGVREFVLKYDDQERAMTPGTAERYASYFHAQVAFLTRMHEALVELDAANEVYFMPQPYWTDAFDLPKYGRGLREAGGLPAGLGLSFTGPGVVSRTIPRAAVDLARVTLGLGGRKAQIYDNLPRGGDLTAYHGRGVDLHESVDTVFSERGTPVTRITMYDYLWNPEAFDPDRSLRLACRELAGRDPEVYRALHAYVTLWNAERDRAAFLPTKEAREQIVASTHRLRERHDALAPLLERSALAGESRLPRTLLRSSEGDTAALTERERYVESMAKHGYREARARQTKTPPTIDGRLDDPAWRTAVPLRGFVFLRDTGLPGQERAGEDPRVPDGEQTEVLVLRDDEHLYVGARLRHEGTPPLFRVDGLPGERKPGAWRDPSLELFLDPDGDRTSYFQIVMSLAGWRSETHHEGFATPLPTGAWWDSGTEFRTTIGKTESLLEARIPLARLGRVPESGDRWAFQVARNLNGASTFSYMFEFFGFRWPMQFGRSVFE